MTALIIIGILVVLITAVLFLPVGADIGFKENFKIKIKFSGLKVYEISAKEDKVTENEEKTTESVTEKPEEKKEGFFEKLKAKYGFMGAVKELFAFAEDLLTHIKRLLRHIKIKKIVINLTVATEDAATTAIEYGAVCSAVYPVLALLSSVGDVKYKSVNINSDFTSAKPYFDFSLSITTKIFFLLLAAFGAYKEYKKFIERQENNERK